jgi:hypothetical protein
MFWKLWGPMNLIHPENDRTVVSSYLIRFFVQTPQGGKWDRTVQTGCDLPGSDGPGVV